MDVQPQVLDDEIDLFQLVETVWDGKVVIAAFVAGAVALGAAFLGLAPQTFSGDVSFRAQAPSYITRFSALNDIPRLDAGQITAEGLLDTFVREFEDYVEVRSAVETEFSQTLDAIAPDKRSAAVVGWAKEFSIAAPGKNQDSYRMTFAAPTEAQGRNVLAAALADTFTTVASQTRANIENLKRSTQVAIINELEVVQTTLDAKTRSYEYEVASRVAFLREQAEIARELGIVQGTSVRVLAPESSDSSVAVRAEEPLYERGYRALEKEISLIQNRSPEAFGHYIAGYRDLVEQRELLLSDTRVAQIERALGQLPLGEGFTPVVIDLELMDVKSNRKTSLVLALSLVLGGMIGVLFVLIRSGFRNYKARQ